MNYNSETSHIGSHLRWGIHAVLSKLIGRINILPNINVISQYACDFVHVLHVHFFGLIPINLNVDVDVFITKTIKELIFFFTYMIGHCLVNFPRFVFLVWKIGWTGCWCWWFWIQTRNKTFDKARRCQAQCSGWSQLPCIWSFHPPHWHNGSTWCALQESENDFFGKTWWNKFEFPWTSLLWRKRMQVSHYNLCTHKRWKDAIGYWLLGSRFVNLLFVFLSKGNEVDSMRSFFNFLKRIM
jgi:hypothetical protein